MRFLKPIRLHHELLKSKELSRGILLGLDVGDKYVGLAVSDSENRIASPLSVLLRSKKNIDVIASDLKSLISELSISALVFGYPFDRTKNSASAVHVNLFVDELCKTEKLGDMKYTYWEECNTSRSVDILLKPLNVPHAVCKNISDKFAAVGILQGYLDFAHRSKGLNPEKQILSAQNDSPSLD